MARLPRTWTSAVNSLFGKPTAARPARPQRRRNHSRAAFESLEPRLVLAAVVNNVPTWEFSGPTSILGAGGEGLEPDPSFALDSLKPASGAVNSIAVHPTSTNTVFIGTANGGVWRTSNITAASPDWEPLTDHLKNLSIGAVAINSTFQPTAPFHHPIFAGIGKHSNSGTFPGGLGGGIYRSLDSGATWTTHGEVALTNSDVTGIAFAENSLTTILVSADNRDEQREGGLFRSTDGGDTWKPVTSSNGLVGDSGTTLRRITHIASDYVDNVFFVGTPFDGIFRGDSQGATWTRMNNGIDGVDLNNAARVRFAVSPATDATHSVFAAIINTAGKFQALYRSTDVGANWQRILPLPSSNEAALDGIDTDKDPTTNEDAEETFYGLIPGGQGATNFSMTVDATDANVVWLAGDRQDELDNNQAGCVGYSGRVFRGAIAPDGTTTWVQFVCANTSRTVTIGANTTFIGTAPHADSRDMAFLPDGSLLEGDDGGIHVLLNPRGLTGAGVPERHWQSRNGDLAVAEIVGAAYNRLTNNVLIGAQDNSSSRGPLDPANDAARRWQMTQGGDGFIQGFAVENPNAAGNGTGMEYAMNNTLHTFRRRQATGGPTDIQLASKAGAARFSGLTNDDVGILSTVTVRKFAINEYEQKDPVHQLVLGGFDLYESFDRGDTITTLTNSGELDGFVSALAYGTSDNHFALYAARQKTIAVREKKNGAFTVTKNVGCDRIRDISINQNDWREAYAVDNLCVHRTLDGGQTWETVFRAAGRGLLYSIELVTHPSRVLFVGTTRGVLQALDPHLNESLAWSNFGKGLPNALVSNLIYDRTDRVLIAATTGRGVWRVELPVTSGQTFNVPLNVGGEMIVTGTSSADTFTLRRRFDDPSLVDVFMNLSTTPAATAPLVSLRRIVVNGLQGDDRLVLDSTNGAIAPGFVNGRVTFNAGEDFGGLDEDVLEFRGGGAGEVYSEGSLSGDEILGDFVFALVQRSRDVEGVQTFGLESIDDQISQPPVLIDTLETLKNGLMQTNLAAAGFAQASAAGTTGCLSIPLIGCSAGQVGSGVGLTRPDAGTPLDDEAVGATSFRRAFQNPGRAVFERILSEGGLLLSDIGNPELDTLAELEARLESLDNVANNVSFTTNATTGLSQFTMQVKRNLDGAADLDVSLLGGRIALRGSVETTADVTVDLVFGIDDRGFYIDTQNGASQFTIGNFAIGEVNGLGRLGPVRVTAEAATLTSDPDAHVSFELSNPAPDPFFPGDAAEDHRIRLYEIDAPIASLFKANIDGDPGDGVADLEFIGSYAVSVFNVNVTDAKVRFTWNDLAQPNVVQVTPVPSETAGEESFGEKIMRLLDIDANTIVDNLLVLADHFQSTIDSSTGIFAREVPILGKTLGDLLGDEVNPVELTNVVGQPPESQPIRSVAPPVVDGGLQSFDVVINGDGPATLGIAVGDPVIFRAVGGPLPEIAGEVTRVGPESVTIAYPSSETQTPDAIAPSLRVLVGGSLVDKLRSALGDVADSEQQSLTLPTIDDLLERLALFTGIDSLSETTLDLDTRRLTIPLRIDPKPLKFTHRLDLGDRIEGLTFDASGDVSVEVDPAFNLVIGVDFSPNLSLAERLFIVEQPDDPLTDDIDERIDATLDVRVSLDNPALAGRLGFLGVSVNETPPPIGQSNEGVQLELSVGLDLVEPDTPGVGAGDDRFGLDEITASNLLDVFDASVEGFVDIDGLTLSASIAGAPPFANVNISLDGQSSVNAPGHLASLDAAEISQLIAGFQITGDLFGYESFNNLSAGDLILLVNQLGHALNGMASGLNPPGGLPLVNKSIDAVADFGEMLADFTADLINPDGTPKFTTFQELVPALAAALGLNPTQIMPTYDPVFNELKVKIQLAHAFSPEGVEIDFGAGGSALSFSASADASFVLNANLGVTLGMRLDEDLEFEDRLFIQSGGALTLTGGIGADNINLGASLGLLGVGIDDGEFQLSLGPQFTLRDPGQIPDGRITLAEIIEDPLGMLDAPTHLASVTGELPLTVTGINVGIDPLNPPAIDISLATPNDLTSIQFLPNAAFDALLADFESFDLEDVAQMIQSLIGLLDSADIGAFDRELPLVNASVNDMLGVVNDLAATVIEIENAFDLSQVMFGLTDLQLATAALPPGTDNAGLTKVITSLTDLLSDDAPETKKSLLVAILSQLRTEIDKLPTSVNGLPLSKIALNNAHTSLDLATSSVAGLGRFLADALGFEAPSTLTLSLTDVNPNPLVVEQAVIARLHWVHDLFDVSRSISFDVGEFGPIQFSGGGDITLNVGGVLDLDIGYNLNRGRAFLLESSQLRTTAAGAVDDFQLQVGIAGVTGSLGPGEILLADGDEPAFIGIDVNGGNPLGVIYFGTDNDPATVDFNVADHLSFTGVHGALTADLPLSISPFGTLGDVLVDFDLATQDLTFQVPDVGAALSGGPFNFGLWVQGIDLVLAGIEAGLEGETLGKLPVIGDNLNLAGELVGDFRTNFLDPIQATIADPTNLENRLKQVILSKLGGVVGGLGILRPAGTDCLAAMPAAITNVNLVDVDIDNVTGQAHINVHLCGQKSFGSDFALDLGGVNLGIETSGGVGGTATYDLELGFGLSKTEGFFFTLDTQPGDPEEIELQFNAFLTAGTTLDAKLFFLDVEASDPTGSTGVSGGVTIDFVDPGGTTPTKLTLPEIQNTPIGTLVDARVEAAADIRLHVEANAAIANDGFLPSMAADLIVDWNFSRTLGEPGSASQQRPTFEIRDLTLSLGEFLSRVASPIAQKVNKYVEPVRPILDLLNSRIPGLADAADALGFGPRTWAEAISFFGGSGGETIERLINILSAVDNFVTDVVALNGQPIEINFGDFTFGNQDLRNGAPNLDAATPVDFIVAATGLSPTVTSQAGAAGGILAAAAADPDTDDDGLGISFPILRNPANLLKMLFGQVVDLVVWDVKPLEFEFVVDQEWPVFPPLPIFVGIGGVVSAKADFLVGFDTRGLKQTGRFFDGFYIGDTPGPEIELFAGVFGSLSVNLGVVEVGGEARLGANFNADWHDGNNDGKLYFDELVRQVSGGGLRCVFDFDGALTAMFNLFADPIGKGDDNKRVFPDPPINITLFEFPLPSCPALPPIDTAHHDFGRLPDESASTPEREILVLNSGPFAPMREQATQRKALGFLHPGVSEADEGETFNVRQTGPDTFEVTAYGVTQVFTGPKAIMALAGDGNDTIVIDASVTVPVYIEGGDDDDVLDAPPQSTVSGGNGNDFLPRYPRPGIGGKVIGGLGHDIIDIRTEFVPPDLPIDWTIEDDRFGFGSNPLDGDELFDVDEFEIAGTAAEDRFDIGNWTGGGTLRGDGNDSVVDTRFNHTDFTLGNDSLDRGGGAGNIALDGIGRATLGNAGNDSQYNVHDAGFTGVATVNAGPGSHTFSSARDTDVSLSDTSVSFGNGGAFNFGAAPIRNANFTGGAGANTYSLQSWNGTATINGGGGHDRMAYTVAGGIAGATTAIGATTIARCFSLRCVPDTSVGGVIYSGIDEIELIGTPDADRLGAGGAPFPVTIRGRGGNDIISGTPFEDSLFGEEGDDTISGDLGIDTIDGGLGNDTLTGFFEPGGEDILIGGPGIDRVSESRDNAQWILNNSFLTIDFDYTASFTPGDIEDALLQGGNSANQFDLSAWSFAATIEGLDGQDEIVDNHDVNFGLSDTLLTRSGLGSIVLAGVEVATLGTVASTASQTFTDNGWHGAATFNAGGGSDVLISQRNANFTLTASQYLPSDGGTFLLSNGAFEAAQLTGSAGANTFNVGGWIGDAMYDGAGGTDTLQYDASAFTSALAATLILSSSSLDRTVLGVSRGKINFANIETRNIIGTSVGDIIDASQASVGFSIDGSGGADQITGGSGPDSLTGGAGNDTLIGNLGNDTLTGGADNDRYVYTAAWNSDSIVEAAGQGTDTIDFSAVNGTSTISILTTGLSIAGSSSGVAYTGSSIEAIIGGLGDDTINVANGATLAGGSSTIDGGGGVNTLAYTAFTTPVTVNLSNLSGTGFGNVLNIRNLIGGTVNDTLTGNSGDNQLEGRNGNDTLVGLGGNDILIDGTGSDSLDGGDGDDTFRIGHTANATETISDSSGSDTLDYSASTGGRVIDLDNTTAVQQVAPTQFLRINTGVVVENYLGSQGIDTLSIDPIDRAPRNVVGNNPTGAPGDVLNYDGKNVPAVIAAGSVHSAGFRPVTFSLWETTNLTNTLNPPPMVTAVRLGFSNPAIPFYDIPVGTNAQLTPLPWVGIQRIQLVFSEDVQFGDPTDLQVTGAAEDYSVDPNFFIYDSATHTATWSLEKPISAADKILLRMPSGRVIDFQGNDLDGEWQNPLPLPGAKGSVFPSGDIFPGGDFQFRFNVVPGDVNQNGSVDLSDFHAQRNRQFRGQGDAAYDILFDTDRNGHINVVDGVVVLNFRGQSLPAGEPAPSPAAAAADAVFAHVVRADAKQIARQPLAARREAAVRRVARPVSEVATLAGSAESKLRAVARREALAETRSETAVDAAIRDRDAAVVGRRRFGD